MNLGLPRWRGSKEFAWCIAGDTSDAGLIPGRGRSPGVGYGNTLQYSCLKNSKEPGRLQSMGLQSLMLVRTSMNCGFNLPTQSSPWTCTFILGGGGGADTKVWEWGVSAAHLSSDLVSVTGNRLFAWPWSTGCTLIDSKRSSFPSLLNNYAEYLGHPLLH